MTIFRRSIGWCLPVVLTLAVGGSEFDWPTQKAGPLMLDRTNYGFLRITSSHNVELVLIDPLGRRIGLDPRVGQSYREIAESDYGSEIVPASSGRQIKLLSVNRPYPGRYTLAVTGVKAGPYVLTVEGNSADSRHQTEIFLPERPIARNEVHIYQFRYDQGLTSNPKPLLVKIVKP